MDFQTIQKLVDDAIFRYDRKEDRMQFYGKYRSYLYTEEVIEKFLAGLEETKLVDGASNQEELRTCLTSEEVSEFTLELPLLSASEKYEIFQIKAVKEQEEFFGIMKNIDLIRRADIDPLTELYNRNGIEKRIPEFLKQVSEKKQTALCMIDLDNFKEVNDTKGHLLGDELLKEISIILKEELGEQALLARVGGDEFLACCAGICDIEGFQKKLGRICEQVRECGAGQYQVGASIGVALTKDEIAYPKLFQQADTALYAAKSNGKNGYCIYDPEMERTKYLSNRLDMAQTASVSAEQSKLYCYLLNEILDVVNQKLSPKETIEQSAQLITEFLGVSRAYASCYMPDGSRIGKSYFYSKEKAENIKPKLALHRDEYAKNFDKDGVFFCTDVTKVNEPIRSELLAMHVKSFLQILFYDEKGKVIGTLGINHSGEKRLWNQGEIDLMQTISKVLTGTILKLQQECVEEEQ